MVKGRQWHKYRIFIHLNQIDAALGLPAYFIEDWRLGVLGLKKRLGQKHKIEEKIVGFPVKIEEKILSFLM